MNTKQRSIALRSIALKRARIEGVHIRRGIEADGQIASVEVRVSGVATATDIGQAIGAGDLEALWQSDERGGYRSRLPGFTEIDALTSAPHYDVNFGDGAAARSTISTIRFTPMTGRGRRARASMTIAIPEPADALVNAVSSRVKEAMPVRINAAA